MELDEAFSSGAGIASRDRGDAGILLLLDVRDRLDSRVRTALDIQSGGTTTSASVNARTSPRAPPTPLLRASPAPFLRSIRRDMTGYRLRISGVLSVLA